MNHFACIVYGLDEGFKFPPSADFTVTSFGWEGFYDGVRPMADAVGRL